jgi:hypothetical protein
MESYVAIKCPDVTILSFSQEVIGLLSEAAVKLSLAVASPHAVDNDLVEPEALVADGAAYGESSEGLLDEVPTVIPLMHPLRCQVFCLLKNRRGWRSVLC